MISRPIGAILLHSVGPSLRALGVLSRSYSSCGVCSAETAGSWERWCLILA